MILLLDNIIWNCLTGDQARFAAGAGLARRYAVGFSPIIGFADLQNPDFASLAPFCQPGEHFYCDGWGGTPPPGWQVEAETQMFKMVFRGTVPAADPFPDAVPLHAGHAAQALELALLTKPGPFGLRTLELGEYFGVFEGERLIAMAGERMQAGTLREISGVCTHPDHQGRGLARQLMEKLLYREAARGETTFLHVMRENTGARGLYERMGFTTYLERVVRVIAPTA